MPNDWVPDESWRDGYDFWKEHDPTSYLGEEWEEEDDSDD